MSHGKGDLLFVWKLDGPRHAKHGLDLRDLAAIAAQRTLIVEFAKQAWEKEGRKPPPDFDERVNLVFYEIGIGSSPVAVYHVVPPPPRSKQKSLPQVDYDAPIRSAVRRAAVMAALTTDAVTSGHVPPYTLSAAAKKNLPAVAGMLRPSDTVDMLVPPDAANDVLTEQIPQSKLVPVRIARNRREKPVTLFRAASFDVEAKSRITSALAEVERLASVPTFSRQPIHKRAEVVSVDRKSRNATVIFDGASYSVLFPAEFTTEFTAACHKHDSADLLLDAHALVEDATGEVLRVESVVRAECVVWKPDLFEALEADVRLRVHAEPKPKRYSPTRDGVDRSPSDGVIPAQPDAVTTTVDEEAARVLSAVERALAAGREIEAVDTVVEYLDNLFLAGRFEAAQHLMSELDPRRLPPQVITGVLMVSTHARAELGTARVDFFERSKAALADVWHVRPEAISSVERRLK